MDVRVMNGDEQEMALVSVNNNLPSTDATAVWWAGS